MAEPAPSPNTSGIQQEPVTITEHAVLYGEYRLLSMDAPLTAPHVLGGQFIHFDIPTRADRLLRRPFSVYKTEGSTLSILYKPVGRGTRAMVELKPGDQTSILGPLGRGFPLHPVDHPMLVAGGYGMAALYMVAESLNTTGTIFMGGRSSEDILCVDEFEKIGWNVEIATVDGSRGTQGFVTDLMDPWLEERGYTGKQKTKEPTFYACGPNPMLKAMWQRALDSDTTAWLSMDRHMGCGIGACLVCVQKVKDPTATPEEWRWSRVCSEGPVYESREIVWEAHE